MARIVLIEAAHPLDETAPPISLGYLASFLEKKYGGLDIIITHSTKGQIPVDLSSEDIVGITAFSQNYNFALELAKNIKEHNQSVPVIMGGPHISPLPETMSEHMDVSVLFEGEETFSDLVEHLLNGFIDKSKLRDIPGLAFYEGDKLVRTEARGFTKELDTLPPPARHLMDIVPGGRLDMITSRGCPYKCIFCSSPALWEGIRYHSLDYVAEEIDFVMEKYKPTRIGFLDDLFVIHKKRFKAILAYMQKQGYHHDVSISFLARTDLLDESVCQAIKDWDCEVGLGFESGSDRVLSQLKGGKLSTSASINAINLLQKYDIKQVGTFILGFPGETMEDMEATYDFIFDNNITTGAVSVCSPLPGTSLWDDAIEKGLVSLDMDWEKLRFNEKYSLEGKILLNDSVSVKELEFMFRKINNYLQYLLVKNFSVKDLLVITRMDIPYFLRTLFSNPRKIARFAKHMIRANVLDSIVSTKT